tara:strand:+ start:277 stop:378 length:102 start_codon:yes stop_codon:yes gene_type:complete
MNEEYFTEYPTHIEIPESYWVSSHDVEYEVIEG